MGNLIFIKDFDSDSQSTLEQSEASGYESENVQDPIVKNTWRSTGDASVTPEWVGFDFGSTVVNAYLFLTGHNLQATDIIKIEWSDSATFVPLIGTATLTWHRKNIVSYDHVATLARYWRIWVDSSAGGNPDGYVEIGRLIMTNQATVMNQNHRPDWQKLYVDLSEGELSEADIHYVNAKDMIQKLSNISFAPVSKATKDQLVTLIESLGSTGYLVVTLDPTVANGDVEETSLYGKIEDDVISIQRIKPGVWQVGPFTIREAL